MPGNYTELCDEVRAWLNRSNLPAVDIDRTIRMTETLIKQKLRSRENRHTAQYNVGGSNGPLVPIPDDFLELVQILPTGTWDDSSSAVVVSPIREDPLEIISYQSIRYQPSATGVPRFAAETPDGFTWELFPAGGQYQISVYYFRQPAALTAANPTNFLLTSAPDFYTSGTLAMAETLLRIPADRRGPWGDIFSGLLQSGQRALSRSQVSGSSLRQRSPYGNQ